MTTQHTHHDHSDVDASVVEHSIVPETTDGPAASETTQPTGEEAEVSTPSPEPATPAEVQEEVHDEAPVVHVEEPLQTDAPAYETQQQDSSETRSSEPATMEAVSQNVEENITIPYAHVVPLMETKDVEVRPFTDFIEQFRQAEAARLQATLRESQIEAFSLLASAEAADLSAPVLMPPSQQEVLSKMVQPSLEAAEEIPPVAAVDIAEPAQTQQVLDASAEAASPSSESEVSETAPIIPPTSEEVTTEASNEISQPVPVVERAVSPLLRSTPRLRPSRHTSRQHQREEVREEAVVETPLQTEPADIQTQPAPAKPAPASVEPPTEPEPPRPARRYRFDRPAATNGSTHTIQQRVEESRTPTSPLIRQETGSSVSEPLAEIRPAASAIQPTEQQAQKPPVVQEPPTTGNNVVSTPAPTEQGRRRGQKEQQPAAAATPPAPEATPPAPEPVVQQEEIAPEDLPPLEYADLQKASSRRRRRHRSGTSNGTTTAAATSTPAPQVAPPPAMPATPPRTPTAPATYSIVSGYTVNQMNQGNDMTGPFMAPDPSPARGSVIARDGRPLSRTEAAHRSAPTPAYPSPVRESSMTSASLTHFANMVSQAIQTQTDAMVAELRRVSQAPTNVSVSLPPFPSTERVGVFVDVANLLYSARTLRIAVDFGKLLDFLRGNRRLVRAQAYCPTSPQAGEEQMFLQAVKGLGYRITTKNYKTFSSGAKKADLDLDLCMDVVRLVEGKAVDCIVLVSGDSDFMPMLDYCSDHGVRVEVAAFDEAMSATLRQSCDLFINLSMLEEIRA